MKIKKIVVPVVIAAVAVILVILATGNKSAAYVSPVPAIQVQKPSQGQVVESVTISGYVEAESMIPVVPFVSGTITEYSVQAGQFVQKDQILAKIDDAAYRQQFLQAEAGYWGYETTFSRVENLYKSGATTQQNYDSAKAQRDAAKAQYDLAKLQLDYTQVKAPVDGTVLIADLAVGSIGNTSQPVAVIADLTNLVIRLKVPEKYFDLFTLERDNILVTVTRPGEIGLYEDAVSSCTIKTIAPYVSAESKNFEVVCKIDEPGERFRPGMFVKVKSAYRIYDDVPVMSVSTLKLDGSFYTYDDKTKKVSYHFVENLIQDDVNFIVPDELSESFFVIDGQNSIFDGQSVNLMDEVVSEKMGVSK